MRYIVSYQRKKKKGYSNQEVTFLDPEGAHLWMCHVESQGAKNIKLTVS